MNNCNFAFSQSKLDLLEMAPPLSITNQLLEPSIMTKRTKV